MKKPNRFVLLGAAGSFVGILALYWLSYAGYIKTRVTTTNLWQGIYVSLFLLVFSFALPQSPHRNDT